MIVVVVVYGGTSGSSPFETDNDGDEESGYFYPFGP